jgi:hypothetical protein
MPTPPQLLRRFEKMSVFNKKLATLTTEELYQAFKKRLVDETELKGCNCADNERNVKRPHGWTCPVHGVRTLF